MGAGSALTHEVALPLEQLESKDAKALLDLVDRLSSSGVGEHIELPQIIVCGDQSSGKSSVLEAISALRFPSTDGLCTTFATEIRLRRSATPYNNVNIQPGESLKHQEAKRKKLSEFRSSYAGDDSLPSVIEAAKVHMRDTLGTSSVFSDSRLCIESNGPARPNLTLVDLPDIFHSTTERQTATDRQLVNTLVREYMHNKRCIVLAITAANVESVLQGVLDMVKEADPNRERTLGIITKPDLIPSSGLRKHYLELARSADTKTSLGWHVLKNGDPDKLDMALSERDASEADFFKQGDWRNVDPNHCGINSLRRRLSSISLRQLKKEIPRIIEEIKENKEQCEALLKALPKPRGTPAQQMSYLNGISMAFHQLVTDAVGGHYLNIPTRKFFDLPPHDPKDPATRPQLRAAIRELNQSFATDMLRKGQARRIVWNDEMTGDVNQGDGNEEDSPPVHIDQLVPELAQKNRQNMGNEPSTTIGPYVFAYFFRQQMEPWERLAEEHLMKVFKCVQSFVTMALENVASEEQTRIAIFFECMDGKLDKCRAGLKTKLKELLRPYHGNYLVNYSKDYVDRARRRQVEKERLLLHQHYSQMENAAATADGPVNVRNFINSWSTQRTTHQGDFEIFHTIALVEEYYHFTLEIFVENITTLAIENCLVDELQNLFPTDEILQWFDRPDYLRRLGGEDEDVSKRREELDDKLSVLDAGYVQCIRYQGLSVGDRSS